MLMVPNVQAHPDITPYRKQRAAGGIHAMLCVPVRGPHHVLGVLSSTSKQRRVFTDDETMALSAYAEQVAIAIEHARLLAAEEERRLYRSGRTPSSAKKLPSASAWRKSGNGSLLNWRPGAPRWSASPTLCRMTSKVL